MPRSTSTLSAAWRKLTGKASDGRFLLLRAVASALFGDFRLTWPQLDWWHDEAFNAYLDLYGERKNPNTHRRWMVWQLLRLTGNVPGDTAECGVYKGATSHLICQANRRDTRIERLHHLFDSFEGLSDPTPVDGKYWKKRDLAAGEDIVAENLAQFDAMIRLYKGWIPERFAEVSDRVFSFVHIDVDLYQPTFDSLSFFYSRLSPGAVLVCDDYGFMTCPGATKAADEFLADKPEKMIALDAGGGFFIKGCPVAR